MQVINFGLLVFACLCWTCFKESISGLRASMFGVTKEEVKANFLRSLMQYRAAVCILNLVPYIALEIMS